MPIAAATMKKPAQAEEKKPKQGAVVLDLTPALVGFEVLAEAGKAKQSDINKMVERACLLQRWRDQIDGELKKAKGYFAEHCEKTDQKKILTRKGAVDFSKSNSYSIPANKIKPLEELFAEEYLNFITLKTEYGVTAQLRALLSDGDYEHSDLIRSSVMIKPSVTVKFTPITK